MTHVMLDLETYGVASGCPVLSIGAVVFSPGSAPNEFYGVARKEQLRFGLWEEPETVKYWQDQSEDARKVLTDPRAVDLDVLLKRFADWLDPAAFVWGNGADFDLPILATAYRACGMAVPWRGFNGRCYRTMKNLAPSVKLIRQGTHHNALDDAKSQAEHLTRVLSALGGLTLG